MEVFNKYKTPLPFRGLADCDSGHIKQIPNTLILNITISTEEPMSGATRVKRKMVKIDEEKCNGCGACVITCAEGALKIIDGKARLVSEKYCDGLGACLGKCPQDAISVIDQVAEEFDEEAVHQYQSSEKQKENKIPFTCPSSAIKQFNCEEPVTQSAASQKSTLTHWPVQLMLVPPGAPFLKNADLLLTADCVPFSYANFHSDFLKDHAVLVACPKQSDLEEDIDKLAAIFSMANVKSITVVHMEVPCCSGLVYMVQQAMEKSNNKIPVTDITIGITGSRKN
jgi:NAD-dependent dihydropyrimidine dehydrogenase PreA subunit